MTLNEIVLLIERARTGDRPAFGELVLRFQPAVYAVALARLHGTSHVAKALPTRVMMDVVFATSPRTWVRKLGCHGCLGEWRFPATGRFRRTSILQVITPARRPHRLPRRQSGPGVNRDALSR